MESPTGKGMSPTIALHSNQSVRFLIGLLAFDSFVDLYIKQKLVFPAFLFETATKFSMKEAM